MKQTTFIHLLGFFLMLFSSCDAQEQVMPIKEYVALTASKAIVPTQDSQFASKAKVPTQDSTFVGFNVPKMFSPTLQVGEYVRRVFEDKAGNLWFGTNGEGIARFNGKDLAYYSTYNGLSGSQVTAIMEDAGGNIWCATNGGVSRFDARLPARAGSLGNDQVGQGKGVTNFTIQEGLTDNWVWSLYQDSKGTIWAGTLKGLCRFDGTKFQSFALPATKAAHPTSHLSTTRVCAITEDKSGKLWFGTDGGGAYSFDGKAFTNFTTTDGLCDNNITSILKDRKGNIWFGSMNGGLSRYDPSAELRAGGKSFTNFNEKTGIGNNEVWNIYEDKKGDIWFSSEGFGVYRFDPSAPLRAGGNKLTNFGKKEGLNIQAVQTIYEDSKGRLWIGGGGGLYRFDGKDTFFNVTKDGLMDGC